MQTCNTRKKTNIHIHNQQYTTPFSCWFQMLTVINVFAHFYNVKTNFSHTRARAHTAILERSTCDRQPPHQPPPTTTTMARRWRARPCEAAHESHRLTPSISTASQHYHQHRRISSSSASHLSIEKMVLVGPLAVCAGRCRRRRVAVTLFVCVCALSERVCRVRRTFE